MEDPDLGEFKNCERLIDMTQKNKYDESLFCKDWVVSKVYYEIYVDGTLQSSEDKTDCWIGHEISLTNDHKLVYGGAFGSWLYSHNYLLCHYYDLFEVAEVIQLTKDVLHIKEEFLAADNPFFYDKSGTHYFWKYEYCAKQ